MKTPPLLLGATLLFWGWQTGYLIPGLVMATVLEGSRVIKARWEFSDEDFTRIWTFCTLVFLAAAVYSFTSNEGPSGFRGFFENPNFFTQRNASAATARTAASLVRWLPMVFCLFMAAQVYSGREGIPLQTISMILRWRWKRARKAGQTPPPAPHVDISFPYVTLCLFAASVHSSDDSTFFWGLSVLLAWALWPQRTRRFNAAVWGTALVVAIGLGYLGQTGVGRLQTYLAGLNPQWLLGFGRHHFDPMQSRTELGSIGRLKASGQIVVRLETKNGPVPPLLREASYRTFKVQTWYAEAADKDFFYIPDPNNSNTYVLVPGKTNSYSVNIACYLDGNKGLLPLPSGSGLLENLTAYQVSKNFLGAVLADGPGLVVFDAHYGPGATLDSAPNEDEDKFVPLKERKALDQVISELRLKKGDPMDQAVLAFNRHFLSKFTYTTWQRPHRITNPNETPLSRFLLQTHHGHCEYFATAAVLLLRELDIPARYAVGYAVHEGSGSRYVVRQRDAHAWCLVWDKQSNSWMDLDLTPSSWVAIEAERGTSFQWLRDIWSRLSFEFSKIRWGQSHWRRYLLWALIPTLALLLYRIIFQARRRRRPRATEPGEATAWPGVDSEFYDLELRLAAHGLVRQPSEPLSDWLRRALREPTLAELKDPLQQLLNLHYRYRFDPRGLSPQERIELRQAARACLQKIERVGSAVQS